MSLRNVIPDEIPSQIKNYDDIILYALGAIGPLERNQFINDPENDITNRMNKNTFHKWAKELKRLNLIDVEPAGKNRIYKITSNGENELLRRLKNYQLDFERVNKIEQSRIKKYIENIKKFFDRHKIIDDDIKVEFLELANEITIDKINIFSEEKINKSILYLVLNHPKFYLLYDISIEDFVKEINKSSEEILTITDLKMFLQLVIEEDLYRLKFFKIKVGDKDNKQLYFKADSQYGIIFEAVIKKKLRRINYLKNLKSIEINMGDLVNEIIDTIVDDYELFDKILKRKLNSLVREYIDNFKQSILTKARFGLPAYTQYFSIIEEIKSSLELLTTSSSYLLRSNKPRKEKYESIFINNKPWSSVYDPSDIPEYLEKKVKEKGPMSNEFSSLIEMMESEDLEQQKKKIDALIPKLENPILIYWNFELYLISRNYNQALEVLEKGRKFKLVPRDFKYYYLKAEVHFFSNEYGEALTNINKAIMLNNEKVKLKYSKFIILKSMDDLNNALNTIDEVINQNSNIEYLVEKTFILIDLKKFDEALLTVERSIELEPDNFLFYLIRIEEILSKIKNPTEILTEYDRLIKKFPNNASIHKSNAIFLKNVKNFNDALLQINKALEITPKDQELSIIKVDLFNSLQDVDALLNIVKNSKSIEVSRYGISLLKSLGNYEQALILSNELLQKMPKPESTAFTKKIFKFIMNSIFSQTKFEELISFSEFLETDVEKIYQIMDLISIKIERLSTFFLMGEEKFLSELKHQLENDEDIPFKEFFKLIYLLGSKKYQDSMEYADELYSQGNQFSHIPVILNGLAYSLVRELKSELAIKVIQKVIQLEPQEGNFYDTYGEILLISGRFEEAIIQFEKAIDLNPEGDYLQESYTKMGECYIKIKKFDLAQKYLEKGLKIAEKSENYRWFEKANNLLKDLKKNAKRNKLILSI